MRDRLIKLLGEHCSVGYETNDCTNPFTDDCAECLADYILSDGWMRVPCKVGTTVFCIVDGFDRVMEGRVKFYTVHSNCIIYEVAIDGYFAQRYNNTDFGYKIFFTREEAEKALKEGGKT